MTDTFLKVDLIRGSTTLALLQGEALFPVSDRLVITSETYHTVEGWRKRDDSLNETQTFVTVDGHKNKHLVAQDFETLKSALTQAGVKIIEPAAAKGIRTLKVEGIKP